MTCKTCVFNGSYGDPKEHRVVKEAIREGTYVECHNALGTVCKGFDAAYPNLSLLQRLNTLGVFNNYGH